MGFLVACVCRVVPVAGVDRNEGYVVYDPVVRVFRSVVRGVGCRSRVSLRRPVLVDQPAPVTVGQYLYEAVHDTTTEYASTPT